MVKDVHVGPGQYAAEGGDAFGYAPPVDIALEILAVRGLDELPVVRLTQAANAAR
jgi:hypothetical protein